MKYILSGVFSFCAILSTAVAQPPAPNWSGAYVGLSGGYQLDGSRFDTFNPAMSSKGFLGGALVGFDRQVGQWVFGAVADFNLANISGSRATQLWQEDLTLEFFGTVRGRGGITYNSTLFYGTGGLAYGRLHSQWKEIDFPSSSDSHSSSVGFAVGGGVEQRLAGYWAWNAEYLYLRLQNYEGKAIFGSATTVHYQSEGDGHIARVGLLYRFE